MKRDIKKDIADTLGYAFIAGLCYVVVTHLHSFDVMRAFGVGDKATQKTEKVTAPADTATNKSARDAAVDFNAARAKVNAARGTNNRTR